MSSNLQLVETFDSRQFVVARWNRNDTTAMVPSAIAVVVFVESVEYKLGCKEKIGYSPTPEDQDQFMILQMESIDEANRICHDSIAKGFAINNTKIVFTPLLGLNGFRLQDAIDFMKTSQPHFNNDELLEVLTMAICQELPERLKILEDGFSFIEQGVSELIQNSACEMFGSFASPVRRNGYSDIDINVESVSAPGQRVSTNVRPLNEVVANPKCLITHPLTKSELETYPQEEIIKILYRCFNENSAFKTKFEMRFLPARTPIIVFKNIEVEGMNVSYDLSVHNQISVEKASLLHEFIVKDKSKGSRMKNAMMFIVHWAKSNKLLSGDYPEEKLEVKTKLNSYIINQLVIHFVQAATNKVHVNPQAKRDSRVNEYNFDTLFGDYCKFFRELFKYYANFDFTNKAIYGKKAMQKKTLSSAHGGVEESPLMLMDPMDITHNISAKVTEDAVKLLNGLIRNALFILKQNHFHINYLLETNTMATMLMKSREPKISISTRVTDGAEHQYLSVQLPAVVITSSDLFLLLTRVLRFNVCPNEQGPSVVDLCTPTGAIFLVTSRAWVGRRNTKRALKNSRHDLTPLQIDVMCSDKYDYEEDIAELRISMSTVPGTRIRLACIDIMRGQVSEVRDAIHFLIDQFINNNYDDLEKNGVQTISRIPIAAPTWP